MRLRNKPTITESQIRYWADVECLTAREICGIIGNGCRMEHVFDAARKYGVNMSRKGKSGYVKGRKNR